MEKTVEIRSAEYAKEQQKELENDKEIKKIQQYDSTIVEKSQKEGFLSIKDAELREYIQNNSNKYIKKILYDTNTIDTIENINYLPISENLLYIIIKYIRGDDIVDEIELKTIDLYNKIYNNINTIDRQQKVSTYPYLNDEIVIKQQDTILWYIKNENTSNDNIIEWDNTDIWIKIQQIFDIRYQQINTIIDGQEWLCKEILFIATICAIKKISIKTLYYERIGRLWIRYNCYNNIKIIDNLILLIQYWLNNKSDWLIIENILSLYNINNKQCIYIYIQLQEQWCLRTVSINDINNFNINQFNTAFINNTISKWMIYMLDKICQEDILNIESCIRFTSFLRSFSDQERQCDNKDIYNNILILGKKQQIVSNTICNKLIDISFEPYKTIKELLEQPSKEWLNIYYKICSKKKYKGQEYFKEDIESIYNRDYEGQEDEELFVIDNDDDIFENLSNIARRILNEEDITKLGIGDTTDIVDGTVNDDKNAAINDTKTFQELAVLQCAELPCALEKDQNMQGNILETK